MVVCDSAWCKVIKFYRCGISMYLSELALANREIKVIGWLFLYKFLPTAVYGFYIPAVFNFDTRGNEIVFRTRRWNFTGMKAVTGTWMGRWMDGWMGGWLDRGDLLMTLAIPKFYELIHSSVICQTAGPQPLPQRFLHLMLSRASSFKWEYPLLSERSFSRFLRLLPRLLVTSICPCIFPSITCFRRQFLRKMWPIQISLPFSYFV